jgi:hypothetical protein
MGGGLPMSNNKENDYLYIKGLDEKLLLEEFRQRYEQYRMHNENRNKYIHFYFIFYFAFWGLVGFLFNSEVKCFLAKYCISVETFLAFAFIMHAIFGSIFFLSIISFRQIQNKEGAALHLLRGNSKILKYCLKAKYPWDREIPCTGITITSQTPLIFLIFMLNLISALLSLLFFCRFCISSCWKEIMCCIFSLIIFSGSPSSYTAFSWFFLFMKFMMSRYWNIIIYSYFIMTQIAIWIGICLFLTQKKWKPKMAGFYEVRKKLDNDC